MEPQLRALLERARSLGYLGPGPVEDHERHADGFVAAWQRHRDAPPLAACDLGSGGGVPGLVLAGRWPEARLVLLEASARRCAFLREAAGLLGTRITVVEDRAERAARAAGLDGAFDLVTARAFGPPAVTAECARRLLGDGGLLLVAEPPEPPADRWPAAGLERLALRCLGSEGEPRIAVLEAVGACPPGIPRRDGVPSKRPSF